MPVFLGPLVGLSLGALLAWLGASDGERAETGRRGLLLVALFGALILAPLVAYFLVVAGDWSYAYLIDSRRVPSAIELVLVLLAAGSAPAGYALTRRRLPVPGQGRALAPLLLAAAPALLSVAVALVLRNRLALDATTAEFRGHFGANPVAGGRLGYALLWTHACLAAGFWVTARALRRAGPSVLGRPAEREGARARGHAAPASLAEGAEPSVLDDHGTEPGGLRRRVQGAEDAIGSPEAPRRPSLAGAAKEEREEEARPRHLGRRGGSR